jgi:4-carboxymuconolactone decarboxylase
VTEPEPDPEPESDDRYTVGLTTAMALFAGSPELPDFAVPAEIASDWGELSMATVMGDVWSRPGLGARDRSLITVALLTALGRPDQLRAYLGVGLNQGLTRSELCEAILHTSVYAGFPAAIEGFRVAAEVFDRYDSPSP